MNWGAEAEFESLFFKNYHPLLEAQIAEGKRITGAEIYRPTYPMMRSHHRHTPPQVI